MQTKTRYLDIDRVVRFLNRSQYLVLALFSIIYFAASCYRASGKLFWYDEIFTVYLSRLPDLATL